MLAGISAGSVSHDEGDKKSALAKAFNYGFNHWDALKRYADDGHLEIGNNTAERAVRGIAVGKKNYLSLGPTRAASEQRSCTRLSKHVN